MPILKLIWQNLWPKLVDLAAAFWHKGLSFPSQTSLIKLVTSLGWCSFQYLNLLAPLKALCWDCSANPSVTHHGLLVSVPPFFFQRLFGGLVWHKTPRYNLFPKLQSGRNMNSWGWNRDSHKDMLLLVIHDPLCCDLKELIVPLWWE